MTMRPRTVIVLLEVETEWPVRQIRKWINGHKSMSDFLIRQTMVNVIKKTKKARCSR